MAYIPRKKPEVAGLPPINSIRPGFQVLITGDNDYLGNRKEWCILNSSMGWAYEYRGFAINKAKHWAGMRDIDSCVVETKSGEIVWSSWDNE